MQYSISKLTIFFFLEYKIQNILFIYGIKLLRAQILQLIPVWVQPTSTNNTQHLIEPKEGTYTLNFKNINYKTVVVHEVKFN